MANSSVVMRGPPMHSIVQSHTCHGRYLCQVPSTTWVVHHDEAATATTLLHQLDTLLQVLDVMGVRCMSFEDTISVYKIIHFEGRNGYMF